VVTDALNTEKHDIRMINSLLRKLDGIKKILKQAEVYELKSQLSDINKKFNEIEDRLSSLD